MSLKSDDFVDVEGEDSRMPVLRKIVPVPIEKHRTHCDHEVTEVLPLASTRGVSHRLAASLALLSHWFPRIAASGDRRTPTPARRGQSVAPWTSSFDLR